MSPLRVKLFALLNAIYGRIWPNGYSLATLYTMLAKGFSSMNRRHFVLLLTTWLIYSGSAVDKNHAQEPVEIINSIDMKLVLIPTPASDEATEFFLGAYEVTQSQYLRIMRDRPSHFHGGRVNLQRASIKTLTSPEFGLDHPVERVSWFDAVEFCRRLSELPEEKAAGRFYRLPTEAEWEHACRAGSSTAFSFGNDPRDLVDFGWFGGNSELRTHPVGQKKPNAWGLYDMHGNVWEWCLSIDLVDSKTLASSPTDSVQAMEEFYFFSDRIVKGGGWFNNPGDCRSDSQMTCPPSFRDFNIGFRVVMIEKN